MTGLVLRMGRVFQLIKLRTNLCELAGNVGHSMGHTGLAGVLRADIAAAQRRCPTYYLSRRPIYHSTRKGDVYDCGRLCLSQVS